MTNGENSELSPQNNVVGYRISEYRPDKHIGREMGLEGDARKADQTRQPVSGPGDPAMPTIALGEDRSNGKRRNRMSGGETAGTQVERPMVGSEPGI